jgi:tetratricopeptide (TPR) repeat protein
MAGVYLAKRNLLQAEPYLRAVLRLEPRNERALSMSAILSADLGRESDALDYLRQGDRRSKKTWVFYDACAQVAIAYRREEEARKCADKLAELRPGRVETMFPQARLLLLERRNNEAVTVLKGILKEKSDHVGALFLISKTLREEKRIKDAIPFAEKLSNVDPSGDTMNNLATLYVLDGRMDRAKEIYLRGLSIFPDHPLLKSNYDHVFANAASRSSSSERTATGRKESP